MVLSSVCTCPFASRWFSWPLQVSDSPSSSTLAPGSAWFTHQSHQQTILHLLYPMLKYSTAPLHISQTSERKGFLRFLNCSHTTSRQLPRASFKLWDPLTELHICYPHIPSCKCVFLGICHALDTLPVSRLADADAHRLAQKEHRPGGWKAFLGFHPNTFCTSHWENTSQGEWENAFFLA